MSKMSNVRPSSEITINSIAQKRYRSRPKIPIGKNLACYHGIRQETSPLRNQWNGTVILKEDEQRSATVQECHEYSYGASPNNREIQQISDKPGWLASSKPKVVYQVHGSGRYVDSEHSKYP